MTEMLGACNSSDLDGNTILVGSNENEYKVISGIELIEFITKDKTIVFV